jgi:hypothetical protein
VSTGLGASNVSGQSDAHWTVGQSTGGTAAAQIATPNDWAWFAGGGGNPPWVANDYPASAWIVRNATTNSQGTDFPYSYSTAFDLTGYDLSTVSISGFWAESDSGTLSLNGTVLSSLTTANDGSQVWDRLHAFSVPTGSSLLVAGVNTLAITITGGDNAWEGARLEGTVTGNAVPEPGSLMLLATGLLGALAYAWRKRAHGIG